MPSREETISRIRTVFTQEGAEGVARAYKLVADGEEKVTRNSLSLNRAFENLERRYNKDIALQQQYAKQQEQINAAVAQNPKLQDRAADTLARMEKEYKKAGASNDNFIRGTKATRYELINLSRQIQDVFVSIGSGQRLGTVALQQGTQVFDVFASSSQGAKGLLRSITALITPTVLLGAGLAGLAVGGAVAVSTWKSYVTALDDVSKASGIAFESLSKLQGAAGVKGISDAEFSSGITKFAQGVSVASTNAGELYKLFRLNGLAVGDTETTLESVAELIKRSGDEQQKLRILQQAGLPATAEWARLLEGGRAGLEKAKAAITGIPSDENIQKAREFDEAVNKIWINGKRLVVEFGGAVVRGFDNIANSAAFKLIEKTLSNLPSIPLPYDVAVRAGAAARSAYDENIARPFLSAIETHSARLGGAPRTRVTVTPAPVPSVPTPRARPAEAGSGEVLDTQSYARQQQELSFLQQRNGLLGQAATVEQLVAAKQQEVNLAQILNNQITPEMARNIVNLYRAQEEYSRAAERVSALGAAATDVEKYAITVQGLSLKLAEGRLSQEDFNRAVSAAHPLFEPLKAATTDFATSLATGMAKGGKFVDVLRESLSNLEQTLIRLATSKIVEQLFGAVAGTGPKGGGLFSFLFERNANGNIFSGGNIIPFARGGVVSQPTVFQMANGGLASMAENEPEAIMPLRRGPDGRLGVAARGDRSMAPKISVVVNNNAGADVSVGEPKIGADGGVRFDVAINRAVKNALQSDLAGHGPMSQSIGRRFGLDATRGIA